MPNDANKLTKTAYPQPQMPQLAPPVLWPVAEVSFRIRQDCLCLVYQGNPMLLKSHESPRHQGRNRRGRGGSARKRQLDKRNRALMQRLRQREQALNSRSSRQGQVNPAFFVLASPWPGYEGSRLAA
ncbi:hypothetical protein ACVWZU_000813 [Thermostichus sp. MS-CIW-26]|jgi:hypothetical protein